MGRKTAIILALGQAVLCWAAGGDAGFGVSQAMAQQDSERGGRPQRPQRQPARGAASNSPTSQEVDIMLRGRGKEEANAATVGIVTARSPDNIMTRATVDLSTLLDKGEEYKDLRIVPIISRGKMQNLWDLLYLRGVDIGFLQTDTLEYLKNDVQGQRVRANIRYIASMFPEDVHIIARPEIRSIRDLAGKTISVNLKGTGAALTMPIILDRLGVKAVLEYETDSVAFDRMRQGSLFAHAVVFGKPNQAVAALKGEGFRLLSVPDTPEINDLYLPSSFTNKDYPNLIPPGQEVETVAVGNVLAAFEWPQSPERAKKIAKFTEEFFANYKELHKPGFHPKWKDVNIGAEVPGWRRLRVAQVWLDKFAKTNSTGAVRPVDGGDLLSQDRQKIRDEFSTFLQLRGGRTGLPQELGQASSPEQRQEENRLFEQFLEWRTRDKRN